MEPAAAADPDKAVRESLRTVLRQNWPMTHVHDGALLTADGFLRLFGQDMTFGGYGMPVPQQDPFLYVVALTAFQPYDDPLEDPVDVIAILTPIYRILATMAVITAVRAGFDGFAKVTEEGINACLPYRPRIDRVVTQYSSLLELTKSVWKAVCHAYTAPGEPSVVRELHAFHPTQKPAPCVWIDVSVDALVPMAETRNVGQWFTLRKRTAGLDQQPGVLSVILMDDQEEGHEDLDVEDCVLIEYTGRSQGTPPSPPSDKRLIARRHLGEAPALIFRRTADPPYVALMQPDASSTYFLLITCERGSFSAFYRNGPDSGALVPYPLYFHPLTAEENAQLVQEEEMQCTASRLGVSAARAPTNRCCVCSHEVARPVYDDFEEAVPGKKRLVYCSQTCVRNMERILLAKEAAERQKRADESARTRQFDARGFAK